MAYERGNTGVSYNARTDTPLFYWYVAYKGLIQGSANLTEDVNQCYAY